MKYFKIDVKEFGNVGLNLSIDFNIKSGVSDFYNHQTPSKKMQQEISNCLEADLKILLKSTKFRHQQTGRQIYLTHQNPFRFSVSSHTSFFDFISPYTKT